MGFLTSHGYTATRPPHRRELWQESGGNPESVGDGGGGLIGWTPLPGGYVTGNPAADLQTQLAAILTFNQIWSQYIPALNAASSPASPRRSTSPISSGPASPRPITLRPPPPPSPLACGI